MNTRELIDLLKGVRPIKDSNGDILVQSIMNMQLVCLTTDDEYSLDDKFANPLEVLSTSNSHYGNLRFTNNSNRDTIAPTQIATMTKQSAQNHGMVKAGYVPAHQTNSFNDAGCVEGNQMGLINNSNEFRFIPVTMREMCFNTVGEVNTHANIYPAIQKLGTDTHSDTGNYLDKYFTKYDKKLEQFIAHFERPEKTIGVIVLIDGEIIAIDKYPSFTYAEQVWDLLIRDCYGALAIVSELRECSGKKVFTEQLKKTRASNGLTTVERLQVALGKTKETISRTVKEKIQDVLDLSLEAEADTEGQDTSSRSVESYLLKHEGYIGQVISEQTYHHMVSIVKKEAYDSAALRQVNEMKRKARGQNPFTL